MEINANRRLRNSKLQQCYQAPDNFFNGGIESSNDLKKFLHPRKFGTRSLYRGLERAAAGYDGMDLSFTEERMAVLSILNGVNQEYQGAGNLGVVPRRQQQLVQPFEKKDHTAAVYERYERNRRQHFSDKLNALVKEMEKYLTAGEEVPSYLWTQYDRLQRDPSYQPLKRPVPGPASYQPFADRLITSKSAPAYSFPKGFPEKSVTLEKQRSPKAKAPVQSLHQRWPKEELELLNQLYWDLGRPRKGVPAADLLDRYAERHLQVFSKRIANDVRQRVAEMWKQNRFQEPGEHEFWKKQQLSLPKLSTQQSKGSNFKNAQEKEGTGSGVGRRRKKSDSMCTPSELSTVSDPQFSLQSRLVSNSSYNSLDSEDFGDGNDQQQFNPPQYIDSSDLVYRQPEVPVEEDVQLPIAVPRNNVDTSQTSSNQWYHKFQKYAGGSEV